MNSHESINNQEPRRYTVNDLEEISGLIAHLESRFQDNCREHFEAASEKQVLELGGKTMLLFRYGPLYLSIIFNNGKAERKGETTKIYTTVKKMIQGEANQEQQRLSYQFRTVNKNLIKWAETEGEKLFQWRATKTEQRGFCRYTWTCQPEKKIL